jgi:tripartite-type tricarboxylate transporter receptor subunit TctC
MRRLGSVLVAALALIALVDAAAAQPYPSRPIRMIVPFSAGAGVTDIMGRLVAQHLSVALGQQVVVDNRPGAAGIVGTEAAVKAPADGYTLLVVNISLAVNPHLYAKLPYDSARDLIPVTMINGAPLMLVVHPSVPAQSVADLVALAKAKPGTLNYGSGGVGTTPHLSGELFRSLTGGIDIVHVPYKGGAPALADTVAGHLSFMIENVPGTMPFVRDNKLRALAITSRQRSPLAPDLPTMIEAGVPDYEMIGWNGFAVASGTPPEIVAKLNTEIVKVLNLPELRQRMTELGADVVANTSEAFAAYIKTETVRWGQIIKDRGIRAE